MPGQVGGPHTQRDATMPRGDPRSPASHGGGGGGGSDGGGGWYLDDHGHSAIIVRTC